MTLRKSEAEQKCILLSPYCVLGLPGGSVGKESACSAGDLGPIPGLGRSPAEGNGYPLQDSGLEKAMDCIVHGATTESDTTESLSLSLLCSRHCARGV